MASKIINIKNKTPINEIEEPNEETIFHVKYESG